METQDNKEQVVAKEAAPAEGTHFDHVKETLELLYKTFPKVFIKDGDVKPLKIGIFEDLKTRIEGVEGLSISKVRAALRLYTSRLKYLYSVTEGAVRIDADGNETGDTVNAEHATYAQDKIKEINQKRNLNKPKRPAPKGKKPFVKKFNNTKGPKKVAPKIEGDKASVEDLKNGTEVLVLSAQNSCVRGVVAQDAQKDSVFVTLKSGLTVNLPLDRVLLPKKAK